MIKINRNPSPRELRQFVYFWLPAAVAVLGAMARWRFHAPKTALVIWSVGAVLTLAGIAIGSLRRPLYIGWMTAVYPIGWTVSHLLLLIVFCLLVTPVGLLMRLRHDPMARRLDRTAKTYWLTRPRKSGTASYFQQY